MVGAWGGGERLEGGEWKEGEKFGKIWEKGEVRPAIFGEKSEGMDG